MSRLSRAVNYLAITTFLVAGILTGHIGHHALGAPQSSHHGSEITADSMLDTGRHDDTENQGNFDKICCISAPASSCGTGHSCSPVPPIGLGSRLEGRADYRNVGDGALNLGAGQLEPPPPKSA